MAIMRQYWSYYDKKLGKANFNLLVYVAGYDLTSA